MRRSWIKRTAQREIVREVKVINKLLLAYLIGLVVTSTLIFIFSEEKVTYRLFAAVITGLTWPLSLIPSIISLIIRKSD
ncbi:putative membrane protein [Escherichia coli 042]|uniref:Membrane protein n=4 Tax=Escherichia coli TaxID=562 RepID=D3GTM9_ECO44|nr:putative membrane protein [Escherichia coli 042]